eukprot:TRINITY_DN2876_c0_g1_i1.p1 TRINITY_DN2876_c0_g1~~TRINITY_DN2876_c0_g1_i1.p1  ORF type:complete len:865 (-),score=62.86 TRINITY_DN2876_c0_g1_i1:2524-5118(-)
MKLLLTSFIRSHYLATNIQKHQNNRRDVYKKQQIAKQLNIKLNIEISAMGCLCDITPTVHQVTPDLPFLTHKQNIRDIYTITQVITFNTVTGLFYAHDVNPPNNLVYLRFCKLRKGSLVALRPRFDRISKSQLEFTHLIPYTAFATTDYHFYLTMPNHRDLCNILDAVKDDLFCITEKTLRNVFYTIIDTLRKMHNAGIAHGQLNPNKILIKEENGYIFDVMIGVEAREDFIVENYYFLAPEVLNGEIPSLASDVWALGATLYYLIAQHTVFNGRDYEEYVSVIATHEPNFAEPVWKIVSSQLKGLIKQMLERDKTNRPTMETIFFSDWVQNRATILDIKLMNNSGDLECDREYNNCVYKLMNILANTKKRETIRGWKQALAASDPPTIEFGAMLAKTLGDSHPLCEEFCSYWQEPINHKKFLLCTIGLSNLVTQERGAILFYQLSKNGKWLDEKDLIKVLECTGNSEYIRDERELKMLIKRHQQNPIRADYKLLFMDFLALCGTLELNPSEEFIMGHFFAAEKQICNCQLFTYYRSNMRSPQQVFQIKHHPHNKLKKMIGGTLRSGGPKKEGQKHQNVYKFRANKYSKKTKALAATPLDHLCKRCYEKVKWKLMYHKYKPRKEPGKCLKCESKSVTKAYRAICDICASRYKICSKCGEKLDEFYHVGPIMTKQQKLDKVEEILATVKEREKRSIIRGILKGEIDYDPVKGLVYTGKDEKDKKSVELTRKKGKSEDEDEMFVSGSDEEDMGSDIEEEEKVPAKPKKEDEEWEDEPEQILAPNFIICQYIYACRIITTRSAIGIIIKQAITHFNSLFYAVSHPRSAQWSRLGTCQSVGGQAVQILPQLPCPGCLQSTYASALPLQ